MKPAKLSLTQAKIHEFAKRRAGATFADVASAAHGRLRQLRDDYDEAPPSYRGYLVPGITNRYCSPSFETATSWPPQEEV